MPSRRLPLAALVGVAILLGSGHVFARFAFANGVNVVTAATTRAVLTSLLLLLLLAIRGMPPWPLPERVGQTLILGVLVAAQTVLIQVAVVHMPVTLAILLFYTYPFLTGVLTSFLGYERLTWPLAGALAAAFGGLVLVLGVAPAAVSPIGVAAALGASVSFTATLLLTPRLAPRLAAPLRTFFMMTCAAAIFIGASLATGDFHLPAGHAGAIGLAGLALCYSVGVIMLFLALPLLGPVQTAVVLNLEPVAVAAIAWLAIGEALNAGQVAGAAIVVAAVIFFQLRARRR